ncbi:uncharacterized protein EV154DRAFT_482199 [Mucor mucedo]|uniref:uncharacterized protein n=1 Tax=Mucor mucedo TaxID=29922 RepID=UPI002220349D|nr:uncharacterized protein EV154DRAFT_482199 [Mucor mucedo]KAI7890468.1 hypothetical protein EV154DRAFT_482199 [Mucor mucedo]
MTNWYMGRLNLLFEYAFDEITRFYAALEVIKAYSAASWNSGIITPVGKCTIIDGWLPATGKWNEGGIFKGSDSNFYFHNVDPHLSQIDATNQGIIGFRSEFLLLN